MLTTNRETKTRREKFGSFQAQKSSENQAFRLGGDLDVKTDRKNRLFSDVDVNLGLEQLPKVEEQVAPVAEPARESVQHANQESHLFVVNKTTSRAKVTLSAKSMVIIACYTLAVLALVVLIAINASTLAGITAKNTATEIQLNEAYANYQELVETYNYLGSEERIMDVATNELNMNNLPKRVVEIELPTLLSRVPEVASTNWFDSICNYLSGVFGG